MQAAHVPAQSCGALVHHSSVEQVAVRKRGLNQPPTNKIRVRPICCAQWMHFLSTISTYFKIKTKLRVISGEDDKAWLPTNIRLLDIRARHEDGHQGMLDSLRSLACCQAPAYMPLRCTARKCARGSPTLSDRCGAGTLFSLAGNHLSLLICQFKSVERAGWRTVAALQVLLDVPLQDWDEGTLNEKGQYTPESDVYQIGVMLLKFQELSTASRAFADKLKSKSLSAADAAEDTYFLYSNVAFVTKNLGRLHCTAHAVLYRCLPMLSLFHESLVVLSRSAFFQTVI